MQRLILIILSAFAFLATPAYAKGSEAFWIVSQRSGDARVVRSGIHPASLTANSALAPGDIVITGSTGRATLARGSDYIVVAPRSELRLPTTPQPTGFTRVIQTLGTMLFKVRHTGTPHFAVDTPMLAAVVKGTTFTVVVDKDRSAVQVIEGAVQVTAMDGGMQGLVEGGKTVFIDRTDPKRLIVADANTLGNSSTSTETSVKINGSQAEPLSAVVELTSGLVRAETAPVSKAGSPAVVGAVLTTIADSGSLTQPDPGATVGAPADAVVPITEPIIGTLPVVDVIAVPIVDALPGVTPVVAPIVAPLTPIVTPIVAPLTPIVTPIVAPLTPIVTPIVAPLTPIVTPIVAPLTPIVTPIVAPLTPIVTPITGIIGSLFGR